MLNHNLNGIQVTQKNMKITKKWDFLPSLSRFNKVEHDFHVDFVMFEHMAIGFTTVPKTAA